MTIKIYEKYGTSTVVESTEVNWKMNSDPSNMYYFYPIKRPLTNDLACSVSKVNFFKVTGATKITDPRIIICSSQKTQIKLHFETDELIPYIDYAGSGYANGIEYDEEVGVKAILINGQEAQYIKHPGIGVDTATERYLPDHLFVNSTICVRINVITGAADKVRYITANKNQNYTAGNVLPGSEIVEDNKASKTYLYIGINNSYEEPTQSYKHNLKFVSTGNMTIDVPLGTSPELASTVMSEYTGAELFTPYIESQLRCTSSEYDDVGNSPQYRLVFMCKIFN